MNKILYFFVCCVWVLSFGGTMYLFWVDRNILNGEGTLTFFGVINILLELIAAPVVVEAFNRLKE